jgi:putative hemolysin
MNLLFTAAGELNWPLVFLILFFGLIMSAFFSGSETGLMSVSRVRLRRDAPTESGRGRTLRSLLRNIEDPILTCLIGTNLFNVMISAVLTVAMATIFGEQGELAAVLLGATLVITFGEILPKVLYREYPEGLTLASVPGIRLAMLLAWPVRKLLLGYTRLWHWILPDKSGHVASGLERRNLAALLLSNSAPNRADRRFGVLMDRYLHLERVTLGPIMQPLDRLVTVRSDATVGQLLEEASRHGFSRFPLVDGAGDLLQGYVLVRDLLFLPLEDHDRPVPRKLWRPLLLVDVRMSPYELFEELSYLSAQMAGVVDPRGNLLGLITLEDLIETVIGSIHDEFDMVPDAIQEAPESPGPAPKEANP